MIDSRLAGCKFSEELAMKNKRRLRRGSERAGQRRAITQGKMPEKRRPPQMRRPSCFLSLAGAVRVLSTARLVFPLAGLRLYGATLVEEWGPTELRAM